MPTDVKASGTGTAGSPLIVTGSVTILNADLAAGLAYKPTTGYSGADVLGLMILDTSDGAQGPVDAISITVNPLPSVNVPAAVTMSMNKTFAFVGGEQLSVVDPANSGSDTVTVTLVVNNGTRAEQYEQFDVPFRKRHSDESPRLHGHRLRCERRFGGRPGLHSRFGIHRERQLKRVDL